MKRYCWAVTLLALGLSVFILTGCGKKSAAVSDDGSGLENLKVLKLPASDWTYIGKEKGWFKEAFEDHGIKVELVEGTIGNEVQLFARGELHFASRMIYPYLLYRTQGADLIAVQASTHPICEVASVTVKADSPYQTFEDLKGKKIASWRAGCPYMVLYELAEGHGWKEGVDWTYINTRESRDALLAGEVDAASNHPLDTIGALITSGLVREIAYPSADSVYVNGGGITVEFTSREFAKQYPNITKKYLELLEYAHQWILGNAAEGAAIVEGINRSPPAVTTLWWERSVGNWNSELNLAKVIQETEALQNWLIEHGDIDAAKRVQVVDLFDPQYFN
jgi:ABC-type nitrate/sulfonate/bicarbonate transport system substrate-binding protein